LSFSQISISDKSLKPKINAIPYDGSFQNFNAKRLISKEQMAGVVGEKITLIDSFMDLTDEYGNDIDYNKKENFVNKTFSIVEYLDGYPSQLKIKNELGTFLMKVGSYYGGEYVFNKYIVTITSKLLNKIFIPLHNESSLESLEGNKLKILGSNEYKITNVSFSKLRSGYGIVLKINNEFECIYNDDKYLILKENWIEFLGTDLLGSPVQLMEKSEFQKFTNQNKTFIKEIRSKQVRIGMSENQCYLAFGLASRGYQSNGFKVQIYGDNYNSINLYFKNGILKLIRK
jgi:hypothetical protein